MVKLATLDQDGNISSASKIADRLMSYFYASDFSQSTASYGDIISLAAIIQKNSNNPDQVASAVSSGLTTLFTPYFDSVNFDVQYEIENRNTEMNIRSRYNLKVYGMVSKDGVDHSLANLLSITNNQLSKVSELEA